MGDWYFENGQVSSHNGDFAYDTDNDAWVEMGSTPGSTPVWWSKYGDGSDCYSDKPASKAKKRARCKREIEHCRKQLEKSDELDALKAKAKHLRRLTNIGMEELRDLFDDLAKLATPAGLFYAWLLGSANSSYWNPRSIGLGVALFIPLIMYILLGIWHSATSGMTERKREQLAEINKEIKALNRQVSDRAFYQKRLVELQRQLADEEFE